MVDFTLFGTLTSFSAKVVISVAALVIAYIIKKLIADRLIFSFAKVTHKENAKQIALPISKLFSVLIYIGAISFIFWLWEFTDALNSMFIGAGVAGIVIGFAAKDIFANILSGIMLFFDKPFKIGDAVKIGETFGTVKDIGLRSTKIKTFDNLYIAIPNGKVDQESIENYSRYNERRFDVVVGVDYATNLDKAEKAIQKAIKTLQKKEIILEKPEQTILLTEFAGSSINFKVLYWVKRDAPIAMFKVKGVLIAEITKEFRKSKITIPFPQVTISKRTK